MGQSRMSRNVIYKKMGKPKFASDLVKSVPKPSKKFGPANLGLPSMPFMDKDKNLISPTTDKIVRRSISKKMKK